MEEIFLRFRCQQTVQLLLVPADSSDRPDNAQVFGIKCARDSRNKNQSHRLLEPWKSDTFYRAPRSHNERRDSLGTSVSYANPAPILGNGGRIALVDSCIQCGKVSDTSIAIELGENFLNRPILIRSRYGKDNMFGLQNFSDRCHTALPLHFSF